MIDPRLIADIENVADEKFIAERLADGEVHRATFLYALFLDERTIRMPAVTIADIRSQDELLRFDDACTKALMESHMAALLPLRTLASCAVMLFKVLAKQAESIDMQAAGEAMGHALVALRDMGEDGGHILPPAVREHLERFLAKNPVPIQGDTEWLEAFTEWLEVFLEGQK